VSSDPEFVVILDPKGVIPSGGPHVLARHENYGHRLSERTQGKVALLVLTRSRAELVGPTERFSLVSYPSLRAWVYGAFTFLRTHGPKVRTIVVGDPWQTFWVSRLLKLGTGAASRVQVQFHGDFFNEGWATMNLKNRLASATLSRVVDWSDSLRFVGVRQMSNALRWRPEIARKCFVSPVAPMLGEFNSSSFDRRSHMTLAVIGRLHKDRGLDSILRLLSCLSTHGYEFRVIFIGDGPESQSLESSLQQLGVDFLMRGRLFDSEFDDAWEEIDVVISMAPVESFGLVPREALSRGKRVIGLSNSGLEELRQEIPKGVGLELLASDWNCEDVDKALSNLEHHEPTPATGEKIRAQIYASTEKLIESWV
jgi:glycosyltransferase involved in cell wall biosynthesis